MKNTNKISFVVALALVAGLCLPGLAVAHDGPHDVIEVEKVAREPVVPGKESPITAPLLDDKSLNNALFLLQIQQELKASYAEYKKLNGVISTTQDKVIHTKDEIGTLREQIIAFQREITLSEEKIHNVAQQIGLQEKELSILQQEVTERSVALEEQKKLLADYMRMLYLNENRFRGDIGSDERISSAKLILSDVNIGETLREMNTLDMLQYRGQLLLEQLQGAQEAILEIHALILQKKTRLDVLKNNLIAEKQHMKDGQEAKAALLRITHGEQQQYEKLIAESMQQQEEAILQIGALQDNFNYVKNNLSRLGNSVSGNELQKLLDTRTQEILEFQAMSDSNSVLQWPVKPSRGISAYFHDSSYKARFGVGHQAIDIPTYQNTQIVAPKEGYVYKTKDNGMGYSYIILSHKDKLMTVYGHVASIQVKEGQFVRAGDIIGLTGGMPGTKGAGYMTTGPHLHLEVIKNGKHVDPLDYLPLTKLPLNSLPEKYTRRVEEQRIQEKHEEISGNSNDSDDGSKLSPEEQMLIDASVEQSGRDEIEAYRRIFGISKDSDTVQP